MPKDTFTFKVPYENDLDWHELVQCAVPGTRLHDPVLMVAEYVHRPRTAKYMHLKLVPYCFDLPSGSCCADFASDHGLHLASPYHLLALMRHVPNIREALNYTVRRGPGLFATDPVRDDDACKEYAVGVWCPGENTAPRAQLVPYNEIFGGLTYFVFSKDQWTFA